MKWCQSCQKWADHTSIGHADWARNQFAEVKGIPESRQSRNSYQGYEKYGDPPNHDHALSQLFVAHEENRQTTAHLAGVLAAHTYAVLSVRDKLDELCALLRWRFGQEDLSGNQEDGSDATGRAEQGPGGEAGSVRGEGGGAGRGDASSGRNGQGAAG